MGYFHHIGLENFRLFSKRTTFSLAPITLITGINNSGKSSLIKSFQLFNSSSQETSGVNVLSFANGKHNLGHFGKAINKKSETKQMTFEFDFELPLIDENGCLSLTYEPPFEDSENAILVAYRIFLASGETILQGKFKEFDEDRNNHYFNFEKLFKLFSEKFDKPFIDNTLELLEELKDWNSDLSLVHSQGWANININNAEIFKLFKNKYIRNYILEDHPLFFDPTLYDGEPFFVKDFDLVDWESKKQIEDSISELFKNGISAVFTQGESKSLFSTAVWAKFYWTVTIENKFPIIKERGWSAVADYILNNYIPYLHESLASFHGRFDSIQSLSSLRANTSRLYANTSDIVDINTLIFELSQMNLSEDDKIISFIKKQLLFFDLGEEIEIIRHQGVASEINIVKKGERTNLADLGYGYSQFLPLIIKVALIAYNKRYFFNGAKDTFNYPPSILLLEEPESNLHPSYQSKLADFIVAAATEFNIQFLVESHSEYMIRKFQFLIATKKLMTEDVNIYYFHQPNSPEFDQAPYRKIEILSDGRLSKEFGNGFFDETPRLLSDLFNSNFNS